MGYDHYELADQVLENLIELKTSGDIVCVDTRDNEVTEQLHKIVAENSCGNDENLFDDIRNEIEGFKEFKELVIDTAK